MPKKGGWVYFMTNRKGGLIYIGVTSDLSRRVSQHKAGSGSAYTKKYNLHRLVYAEFWDNIEEAIAREKAMKAWNKQWKVELLEKSNPGWEEILPY